MRPHSLSEGVRVFLPNDIFLRDRAEISNGMLTGQSEDYSADAIVPKHPWRRLTCFEENLLIGNDSKAPPWTIAVIPFNEMDCQASRLEAPIGITSLQDATSAAKLLNSSRKFFNFNSDPLCIGSSAYSGGLSTVTIDRNLNKKIGLHIDSWDALPLHKRSNSRTRICVNLGQTFRYFLFCNLNLVDMARYLTNHLDIDTSGFDPNEMYKHFFHAFPNYPAIRIKIMPFEGYLAPTEILVHDASTLGTRLESSVITFLGQFSLRKL